MGWWTLAIDEVKDGRDKIQIADLKRGEKVQHWLWGAGEIVRVNARTYTVKFVGKAGTIQPGERLAVGKRYISCKEARS